MGLNIGRLLYGIRTKYEMNVKDICRGICSPSSYCMYENGEIVPDILLVNMFSVSYTHLTLPTIA